MAVWGKTLLLEEVKKLGKFYHVFKA